MKGKTNSWQSFSNYKNQTRYEKVFHLQQLAQVHESRLLHAVILFNSKTIDIKTPQNPSGIFDISDITAIKHFMDSFFSPHKVSICKLRPLEYRGLMFSLIRY